MKSKANIKGHPLHPILVSFPLSLLTGAFVLDIISLLRGEGSYAQAAMYAEIGGLLSAVAAAVPGILDYYYRVPPKSSAKNRAAKHGLINSSAVLVFTLAFLLRLRNDISLFSIVSLEMIGVILLGIAGWLGGTLITRNQIGVDHRYASAGKWQEETINTAGNTVELKNLDELMVNQMKLLHVNKKRIVVARTEAGLIAFDDRCAHRGGSLADGAMICETVQCPWHGSQFHGRTGMLKAGPAAENIKSYNLKVEDQVVWLQL